MKVQQMADDHESWRWRRGRCNATCCWK